MSEFQQLDPANLTATQVNALLRPKGRGGVGPVPPEAVLVGMAVLLPSGFNQGDVASLEAAVEGLNGVTKAVVCTGHKSPAATVAPADHDLRLTLETRLQYQPTV